MQRDRNLHPLSFEHHIALTAVIHLRRLLAHAAADLTAFTRQLLDFEAGSLGPHYAREEELLLPILRARGAAPELAERLLADHDRLRGLGLELRVSLAHDRDLRLPLERFGELLEDHIRFEERVLFSELERRATAEELAAMGGRLWRELPESVVTPGGSGCPSPLRGQGSPGF